MIGLVVLMLAGCASVIYFGDKILQTKATKLQELKLQEAELEQKKLLLSRAQEDVNRYSYIVDIARTVVPQDKDQARAIREINQIAQISNVGLQSITFPNSTLGDKKQNSLATPAPESSQAPTTPPPITQAQPVQGIPGVYSMDIEIQSETEVPYYNMLEFLQRLEKNRRTAQVYEVRVTPTDAGRESDVSFILKLRVFIKPS